MDSSHNYQAYGSLLLSITKHEDGTFSASYKNQPINIKMSDRALKHLEKHVEVLPSIVSGEPVVCGLYPRTDTERNLTSCVVRSVKLYTGEPVDNFFIIRGRVVHINKNEQRLAIRIYVKKEKNKNPFPVTMIYSQPIIGLEVNQIWDIKAELEDGKLKAISGEFIENFASDAEGILISIQPYARLPVSLSKDAEGNFFSLYEKQIIQTKFNARILKELEDSPSVLSGQPVLCGIYARTDINCHLKRFYIVSIKPYSGKPIDSYFSMRGRVKKVQEEEQKIVIKIYPESASTLTYNIDMIYSHPIAGLEVDQVWDIKAELIDGQLSVVSGAFVEKYVKKNQLESVDTIVDVDVTSEEIVEEKSDNNIDEVTDKASTKKSKKSKKTSSSVKALSEQVEEDNSNNITEAVETTTQTTTKTKKAKQADSDLEVVFEQLLQENSNNNITEVADTATKKTTKTKKSASSLQEKEVLSEQVVKEDNKSTEVAETAKTSKTKKAKKDVEVASEKVAQKSHNNEILAIIKPTTNVEVTPEPVAKSNRGEVARTLGKLEITIKISELPEVKTVENGWQQFELECDGKIVSVTLKPKVWKKLTDAQTNYPMWVASVTGKIGQATSNGFELVEANVQTFEKKPKEPKPCQEAS
jgi:hypothetical protein